MSFSRNFRPQGGTIHDEYWCSLSRNNNLNCNNRNRTRNNGYMRNFNKSHHEYYNSGRYRDCNYVKPDNNNNGPSWKRRKFSDSTWGDCSGGRPYLPPNAYEFGSSTSCFNPGPPTRFNSDASTSTCCKRDRSKLDDDEPVFMSRDEIERHSPSRKDGIDALRETHLRYSYCAFIQNVGLCLEL